MKPLKPGLYFNISEERYRSDPAIAQSDLEYIETPEVFWERKVDPNRGEHTISKKDSEAMRRGRIFHHLLLEPESFLDYYCVTPGSSYDPKKKIVKRFEFEEMERQVKSIKAHRKFPAYCLGAKCEVVMVWPHPDTGLMMKGKTDMFQPDCILDIKKVAEFNDFAIRRASSAWALQESQYLEGREVLRKMLKDKTALYYCNESDDDEVGKMVKAFVDYDGVDVMLFIAQTAKYPYPAKFFMVSPSTKMEGITKRDEYITTINQMYAEHGDDRWPTMADDDSIHVIDSWRGDITEDIVGSYKEREVIENG